jgi:hypothetical protein
MDCERRHRKPVRCGTGLLREILTLRLREEASGWRDRAEDYRLFIGALNTSTT